MTLKKRYIQVADKKDYFLSCNFKWESQARQSLHLRTFLFGSVTGCEKSTTGISSCDYSAKCHLPKKEGAKTLHFWLSITRLSLQLAFELRWEYYSLDNEQYYKNAKTYHLSQLRISRKAKIKIYLIIHYYTEFF